MFNLFSDQFPFVIRILVIILSLTLHESAHAFAANHLGDPTPRLQGRLSLNPLKHLDLMGTVALVLTRFGWGKPVEIDPYNLKNPVRDNALIALAGPTTNITIALISALVLNTVGVALPVLVTLTLVYAVLMNLSLAFFNLIPIHPLDGSKVLVALLPHDLAQTYDSIMSRFGMFILIFLIFPWGGTAAPVSFLLSPIIDTLFGLLVP